MGDINVTVRPVGTVKVQVGQQQGGTVRTINGNRSLKGSSDLSMSGAQNGDVIVYQANTNSFVVEPASSMIPNLDAGLF